MSLLSRAPALAILSCVCALAGNAAAHGGGHGPPRGADGPRCDPDVLASFAELEDAMRHVRDEVRSLRGKGGDKAHMKDDLAVAFARLEAARDMACLASTPEVVVLQPRPPAVIVLDRSGEASLADAMHRASFEDERLAVLALGVRDVCVTAEQAKALTREMAFSRGRLGAVRVLAPRIVDRARAFVLLDALAFDADRREARDILNAAPVAPECRVPTRA